MILASFLSLFPSFPLSLCFLSVAMFPPFAFSLMTSSLLCLQRFYSLCFLYIFI